ncbi:MAG: OmpH family outer membrane protein [Candidatus Latescibacteria bacterium]|nr:OmpH family outer membrane protein [Candidatus Latescibacterota bacterium]
MSHNMKKITYCVLAISCTFITMGALNAGAELKIGYIRPQYIFDKYEPYKTAMKELGEYEKEEVDKLQKQGEELQKEFQDAEKRALLMSEEMIQKKREELQKSREDLDKYYDELYNQRTGKLVKEQEKLLQPIINRINEILMKIGKEENYDYIFDAEGPILYADEKYDLSDYLLEELAKDVSSQ